MKPHRVINQNKLLELYLKNLLGPINAYHMKVAWLNELSSASVQATAFCTICSFWVIFLKAISYKTYCNSLNEQLREQKHNSLFPRPCAANKMQLVHHLKLGKIPPAHCVNWASSSSYESSRTSKSSSCCFTGMTLHPQLKLEWTVNQKFRFVRTQFLPISSYPKSDGR